MAESTDLEPVQWLDRLGRQLIDRRPLIDTWRRYYEGDHDLPAGPSQHRDAFQEFQKAARTNLCRLCADSMLHRTKVTGFRDTSAQAGVADTDNVIWKLWQSARLDARQYAIWRKAYSLGSGYAIVGVHPDKPTLPRVTIEGPENVIVEHDPADERRRLAALRMWHDSVAKRWMATLYLPGQRLHYQSRRKHARDHGKLQQPLRFTEATWELRRDPERSLPEVPVIPFYNAEEGDPPRAEFDVGLDVQNRLNLTVLTRLTADRYASFRQRGVLNFEPETDPVTGVKISPFPPGQHQFWMLPPPDPGMPEPKMFDFSQTDTSNMLRGVEADMRAFAAITITPVYYLPGDMINIGADSVAALDAGHTSKIKQRHTLWGEEIEQLLQLMADVAGVERDLTESETVWERPENFHPASVADYMSKLVAAHVPLPMVAEEIGWSPQRVAQLRAELAAQHLQQMMAQQMQMATAGEQPPPTTNGVSRATPPPSNPANTPPPARSSNGGQVPAAQLTGA